MEFDAYGNIFFYTDNTSYRGRAILRQQPLPGLEGHISYSFNDKVWVSLDTRYSFRATTYVDGYPLKMLTDFVVLFYILLGGQVLAFSVASFRLIHFKCPRCNERFSTAFIHNPFARRCVHCNLPKWQLNP